VVDVAGGLIAVERAARKERVVLEIAVDFDVSGLIPPREPLFVLVPESIPYELEGIDRGLGVLVLAEHQRGLGEGGDQ